MIDLSRIEDYRENNRIEAKKALGGLPKSIWETYSSFANTLGGIILLGVEEHRDRTLHPVDLPDPEALVEKFRAILSDRSFVSADILGDGGARTELAEGKRIVVITVPRARRELRPVYIGGDPFTGTYRRSGEGDYRCTREEVAAMLRDAQGISPDRAAAAVPLSSLSMRCVEDYRLLVADEQMKDLPYPLFLRAAGAAAEFGGELKPTAAGLLMFGRNSDICAQFPHYFLEYRDNCPGEGTRPSSNFCISSDSGLEYGNVFEFFMSVRGKLGADADSELSAALTEALVNCLCNADYHGRKGVIILKNAGGYVFSNPGLFRADISAPEAGGLSDPRNKGLSRMFALAGIGRGSGGGIREIFSLWDRRGWVRPALKESFAPERTMFTLTFTPRRGGRRDKPRAYVHDKALASKIIVYLTDNISADVTTLSSQLGNSLSDIKKCLRALLSLGVVVADGGAYRLKS